MKKEIITSTLLGMVIGLLECALQLWGGIFREQGIWFPTPSPRLRFLLAALGIYLIFSLVIALISSVLARLLAGRSRKNLSSFLSAGIFLGLFVATQFFYGGVPLRWTRGEVIIGGAVLFFGGVGLLLLCRRLPFFRLSRGIRSRGVAILLLFALGLGAADLSLVWFPSSVSSPPDLRPNIILVSIDTLRRDRVGCYGYSRPVTPRIDRLARRGTIFDNAYAQYHSTLPSHMSMMTSLPPLVHGVIDDRDVLSRRITTLAELLTRSGYHCLAFVDGKKRSKIGGSHGFSRGFQWYGHYPEDTTVWSRLLPVRFLLGIKILFNRYFPAHGRPITNNVISWLQRIRVRPFFLFLHYYGVHAQPSGLPYWRYPPRDQYLVDLPVDPRHFEIGGVSGARFLLKIVNSPRRARFQEDDLPVLRQLYDCGVAYVDEQMGLLEDALKDLNLLDDTVIIITSDHGEEFLEHSRLSHQQDYGECLRVPLIIIEPPGPEKAERIDSLVEGIDLAPTILELAGVALPEEMMGLSLLPALQGRSFPDRVMIGGAGKALQSRRYSLLKREGKFELYDLREDPGQKNELSLSRPDDYSYWLEVYKKKVKDCLKRRTALGLKEGEAKLNLSPRERRELESLGYVN